MNPPPNKRPPRKRYLLWLFITPILLFLLIGLTTPLWLRCRKKSDQTEAISNARQIGLALFEFHHEFHEYPSDSTIARTQSLNPNHGIPLGSSSSNDYFRQLIASGVCQSEALFYAKSKASIRPDGRINGKNALAPRECAFAYLLLPSSSPDSAPPVPIAIAPAIPGQKRLDSKIFDGKALVLLSDTSVSSYPVTKSGKVLINGKDLFDPTQPFWNGKTPDVKWPE